jgi:hypothetical protein
MNPKYNFETFMGKIFHQVKVGVVSQGPKPWVL